jgi:CMP/dCMP kinase
MSHHVGGRHDVRPALIAVAGGPGTGTTTLCRLLAERLGAAHVYAGQVFRAMAAEHGMDVVAFSKYAEGRPEVDHELDRRMIELARGPSVVLDARLSAWHAARAEVPALRVLLTVPARVAAERVAAREGRADIEAVLAENTEREASERRRYRDLYDFDPSEVSHYDLVLDSSTMGPDEIADWVVARLEGFADQRPGPLTRRT